MAGLTNPMHGVGTLPAATPPLPTGAPAAPAGGNAPPAPPAPPAQPGAAPQPTQGQQQPKGPPLTEGPVDPELLKKYEANCMNTVTGGLAQIIKMVTQSQDKVEALAQATVFTVMRVEDSLEQSGGKLNLAMTFAGGAETVTDIADAMQKAGVYDYQQKEIDAAFLRAVDQYRMLRQQQGRLDPATFQQIIAQMKQAQANGTLDQQYPGLTQFAQQAQKNAKPAYKQKGATPATPAPNAAAAPPSALDSDGPDAEDAADQGADATDGSAPVPAAGGNFPAKMLKPTAGKHVVASHLRRNPSTPPPTKSKKAAARAAKAKKPVASAEPAPASNKFPAAMLKKKGGV